MIEVCGTGSTHSSTIYSLNFKKTITVCKLLIYDCVHDFGYLTLTGVFGNKLDVV